MAQVGRDLKDHEPPHHRQGHQPPHLIPDQAAQGPIQPNLEHHLGWLRSTLLCSNTELS